jgi:hypothetical protein
MFYIFAVHPVCSTNGPMHNDSNPTGLLCQLPNWYVSLQYSYTFLAAHAAKVTSLKFRPSDKVS